MRFIRCPYSPLVEGIFNLWRGASLNVTRAILMTVGQIAFYEQVKQLLISTGYVPTDIGLSLV